MSIMSVNRIKYMREALEAEEISMGELAEIHAAFLEIPEKELPEPRENAMAEDELNELEARVTPLEWSIYNFVLKNFGYSESVDPSWDIGALAEHLEREFTFKSIREEK